MLNPSMLLSPWSFSSFWDIWKERVGPLSIRAIPMEAKYENVVVCVRLFNRLGRKKENRKAMGKMNPRGQPPMWKDRNIFLISVGPGDKIVWLLHMFSLLLTYWRKKEDVNNSTLSSSLCLNLSLCSILLSEHLGNDFCGKNNQNACRGEQRGKLNNTYKFSKAEHMIYKGFLHTQFWQ